MPSNICKYNKNEAGIIRRNERRERKTTRERDKRSIIKNAVIMIFPNRESKYLTSPTRCGIPSFDPADFRRRMLILLIHVITNILLFKPAYFAGNIAERNTRWKFRDAFK